MSEFDVFSISVDDFKKSEYASILLPPRSHSYFEMESYFFSCCHFISKKKM